MKDTRETIALILLVASIILAVTGAIIKSIGNEEHGICIVGIATYSALASMILERHDFYKKLIGLLICIETLIIHPIFFVIMLIMWIMFIVMDLFKDPWI